MSQPLRKYFQNGALIVAIGFLIMPQTSMAQNQVNGNMIQFNDNGAWSWFSEERAIVDKTNGSLLIGSVTESNGAGGRDADAEISTFSFGNGARNRFTLNSSLGPGQGGNDHNSPVLTQLNDGRYIAAYATHGLDSLSRFRTSSNASDATSWNSEVTTNNGAATTYSNVFQLSEESGRIYNFHRSRGFDPNFSFSDDGGATWAYGGRVLNDTPSDPNTVNGVRPYANYASNGKNEIHFINTETHPVNQNTSIYHSVIRDGKIHNSSGTVIDNNLYDTAANVPTAGTQVFAGSSSRAAWGSDVELDSSGNPYIAFTTQVNGSADDLRYHYARFDGTSWQQNEIGFGGSALLPGQADYSGNISLDPNDPNTVYISSNVNPNSGAAVFSSADNQQHYEIYKGVTSDGGQNFTWSAITENSAVDNLRPIVPDWDSNNTAVAWLRGTYGLPSSQFGAGFLDYDLAVVGIVEQANQQMGSIEYVDASSANTQFADGSALNVTTGSGQGAADGLWHERTGFGNGGSVLTAGETGGEDVNTLETIVTNDGPAGEFDVFAYFWSNDPNQWELRAGLSENELVWVREQGAEQVDLLEFSNGVLGSDIGELSLYQFYVGRASLDAGEDLSVFINRGFSNDQSGRTWYDGVGFARVSAVPEPSTGLVLSALIVAGLYRRRR